MKERKRIAHSQLDSLIFLHILRVPCNILVHQAELPSFFMTFNFWGDVGSFLVSHVFSCESSSIPDNDDRVSRSVKCFKSASNDQVKCIMYYNLYLVHIIQYV